eukprot:9259017-Ditylum_brightwellii.AAC.1
MVWPLILSATGIIVCLLCSFIATDIFTVKKEADVETALKVQLISTTALMIPATYGAAVWFLPAEFYLKQTVGTGTLTLNPWQAW